MSVINKKREDCCGCNACAETCPKHCITMAEDREGFLFPRVDTSVCVECGLCEKVCPFEDGKVSAQTPISAYAAWNNDREQYLCSSSGGAAFVLSSAILKRGGVVYGCASHGVSVSHIRVDSLSDLVKLQGSKYVQSDVRGVYSKVKADLKANVPVLFIGTPCQVAGLKSYINDVPGHLYLVDLICHGVPSQKMLSEHVRHVCKGGSIDGISFRRGNKFRLELKGDNFHYDSGNFWRDGYLRSFMSSFIYRLSCYNCVFAKLERCSDMTIGDFWGLKSRLKPDAKDGISVMLPCTAKGLQLLELSKRQMTVIERDVQEAVSDNAQLRHPTRLTFRRRLFSAMYCVMPFDAAANTLILGERAKTLWNIVTSRQKKAHD